MQVLKLLIQVAQNNLSLVHIKDCDICKLKTLLLFSKHCQNEPYSLDSCPLLVLCLSLVGNLHACMVLRKTHVSIPC